MRNYRILRLAGLHYEAAMRLPYLRRPDLASRPYDEQLRNVFGESLVYGDSFSSAMRELGHDAHEVLYDLEPLQRAWAREHGLSCDGERWKEQIMLAQIEVVRPDVLFLQDVYSLRPEVRRGLKQRFPFLRLVATFKGSAGGEHELGDLDVIFAGTPPMVRWYEEAGLRATLLYHAFDARVLDRLGPPGAEPPLDFTFAGSTGYGFGWRLVSRFWTLLDLAERTQLQLWIDELVEKPSGPLDAARIRAGQGLRRALVHGDARALQGLLRLTAPWRRLQVVVEQALDDQRRMRAAEREGIATLARGLPARPLREMLPGRCGEPVFGLDLYRLLRRSRITFNLHTDTVRGFAGNIRLFEATGAGTCLLTDRASNLGDLFEPDREVVTYGSLDECVEKVRYLLDHEGERAAIARAGQARTLRDHSVAVRARRIDEELQSRL